MRIKELKWLKDAVCQNSVCSVLFCSGMVDLPWCSSAANCSAWHECLEHTAKRLGFSVLLSWSREAQTFLLSPIFLAHHSWDRTRQSKLPTPLTLSILSCNVQPLRCIFLKADESHVSHASKVQSGNLLYSHFFFTLRVAKEPSSSAPVTVSRVACPDSASTCYDKPLQFVIFSAHLIGGFSLCKLSFVCFWIVWSLFCLCERVPCWKQSCPCLKLLKVSRLLCFGSTTRRRFFFELWIRKERDGEKCLFHLCFTYRCPNLKGEKKQPLGLACCPLSHRSEGAFVKWSNLWVAFTLTKSNWPKPQMQNSRRSSRKIRKAPVLISHYAVCSPLTYSDMFWCFDYTLPV